MSDGRLRGLERAWKESGTEDDARAYLNERVRAEGWPIERLVAAAAGGEKAEDILNWWDGTQPPNGFIVSGAFYPLMEESSGDIDEDIRTAFRLYTGIDLDPTAEVEPVRLLSARGTGMPPPAAPIQPQGMEVRHNGVSVGYSQPQTVLDFGHEFSLSDVGDRVMVRLVEPDTGEKLREMEQKLNRMEQRLRALDG